MRLLFAMNQVSDRLLWSCEDLGWAVSQAQTGQQALYLLQQENYDLLALDACLAGLDGLSAGSAYAASQPFLPPRILLIQPDEWPRPSWADCVAPLCTAADKLCRLLQILSKKPLPKLAAALEPSALAYADAFLCQLGMDKRYKGCRYAAWLLAYLCRCTLAEQLPAEALYQACGQAFGVTAASVERCLRVAVESVFTHGSLSGIERAFGATIDPERGKPTNRAFLLQGMQQLRYSFTAARSPNSSDTHQSPAAPTMV